MISCTCYGSEKKFESREKAIAFFTECMFCSEGAEQNRYVDMLWQLYNGNTKCEV